LLKRLAPPLAYVAYHVVRRRVCGLPLRVEDDEREDDEEDEVEDGIHRLGVLLGPPHDKRRLAQQLHWCPAPIVGHTVVPLSSLTVGQCAVGGWQF